MAVTCNSRNLNYTFISLIIRRKKDYHQTSNRAGTAENVKLNDHDWAIRSDLVLKNYVNFVWKLVGSIKAASWS